MALRQREVLIETGARDASCASDRSRARTSCASRGRAGTSTRSTTTRSTPARRASRPCSRWASSRPACCRGSQRTGSGCDRAQLQGALQGEGLAGRRAGPARARRPRATRRRCVLRARGGARGRRRGRGPGLGHGAGDMSDYAWVPTPEAIEHANVTRFMRAHGVADIDELRARSVADIDWFWDAVVRISGCRSRGPTSAVRDSSRGIEWTTWFTDGASTPRPLRAQRWRGAGARRSSTRPRPARSARSPTTSCGPRSTASRAGCASLGVGKGDVVALFMPMVPEAAVALYADGRGRGGLAAALLGLRGGRDRGAAERRRGQGRLHRRRDVAARQARAAEARARRGRRGRATASSTSSAAPARTRLASRAATTSDCSSGRASRSRTPTPRTRC